MLSPIHTQQNMAEPAAEADSGRSIQEYAELLWQKKWLVLAVTALVVSGVALWTYRKIPLYHASTSLIIDQQMPQVLGDVTEVVDISPHAYRDTKHYMETQVTVACSSGVRRGVAQQLNLARVEKFWPTAKPGQRPRRTLEAATAMLGGMVRCSARRNASIIDIGVTHRDPELAAQLATGMAQAFIDHNMEHKLSSTASAMQWLAKRAEELKTDLERAESDLFAYRKKNDLISTTLEDRQSLQSEEIRAISRKLNDVRNERIALTAHVGQLKDLRLDDPGSMPTLPLLRTPILQELKLALLHAQGAHRELSDRYGDKHPKVVAQLTRVAQAKQGLQHEVRNLVAGAQKELRQSATTESLLQRAIDDSKTRAYAINKRVMHYRRLQRNAQNARKVYAMVVGRMSEGDLTSKLRANNVRLLESAAVPGAPVYPRKRFNMLAGLFIGLMAGVGLALLLRLLDTRLASQADLQAAGVVYLGSVPPVEGVPAEAPAAKSAGARIRELTAQQFPMSRAAEECRAIRTNLLLSSPDRPLKKLLVTSPGSGEGKTLFSANLAITAAQQGLRVLLIDADMRRGRLHRVFGVPHQDGLTSALCADATSEAEIADSASLIRQTGVPNLELMTRGATPPNPAELCHSQRLRQLLAELSDRYDLLVIDSPPVMAVTDAVVLSSASDGTVMVARTGQTAKGLLREAQRRLLDVGAPLLGCVINGLDPLGSRYAYRYASRYASDIDLPSAQPASSSDRDA